jgi:hypothetical protein
MKQANWQTIVQQQFLRPSVIRITKQRAKRLASGKPTMFTGGFKETYFSFCIQCGESVSHIKNGQEQMRIFQLHTCG